MWASLRVDVHACAKPLLGDHVRVLKKKKQKKIVIKSENIHTD